MVDGFRASEQSWTALLLDVKSRGMLVDPTLATGDGEQPIPSEQENAELIMPDFVEAVEKGREPHVPGWSVLPAMRVLHRVQEEWDAKHGKQTLPGRPVT